MESFMRLAQTGGQFREYTCGSQILAPELWRHRDNVRTGQRCKFDIP